MIFNFETEKKEEAAASLIIYSIYRSRDMSRFKVSMDMWPKITRFAKASAKRSKNVQMFIESFSPKLCCESINPKWTQIGISGRLIQHGDSFIEFNKARKEFLTTVINGLDHSEIIKKIYNETLWIIMLVRDRIEREKPLETQYKKDVEA